MSKNLIIIFCIFLFTFCVNYNANASVRSRHKIAHSYAQYGKRYHVLHTSKNYREKGVASWYGRRFNRKRTSSGERYNMYQLTAAHKTLPFSTHVLVTNLKNGRTVKVRVNDRGPFVRHRVIDLSYAAAKKLGMVGRGTAPVVIKAL